MANTVHPHMRGADAIDQLHGDTLGRFIPTCVGQMVYVHILRKLGNGSSPHAWGRCSRIGSIETHVAGSSPHAWGRCFC